MLSDTIYLGAFRNLINLGSTTPYYDIAVGAGFVAEWSGMKRGSQFVSRSAIDVERALARLFGYERVEINEGGRSFHVTIDYERHPIEALGGGFSQFFIVLATAAKRRPAILLVDEPELNLHPRLQLEFIAALQSFASSAVLFATHSVGLARVTADDVYVVHRETEGHSRVHTWDDHPDAAELLGELSFSAYRELGYDSVLLVEGTTDLRALLPFMRDLRRNEKYVMVPLGGGSMIRAGREPELAELQRLADNVVVLIDSERPADGEPLEQSRQAFVDSCHKLGIRSCVLERRALENYFSETAIRRAMRSDKYRALEPFERLEDAPHGWAKADGWKITTEMNVSELDGTDLGAFLGTL
jgi:ABC-type cobalamin/Fe3+-siderophores transport system ATPase subunit